MNKMRARGHLATVWRDIGRPGAAKLAAAIRQRGFKVSPQRVKTFVREQPTAQVFQSRPLSKGKAIAASRDSRWQAATINFSARAAGVNMGLQIHPCGGGCLEPKGHGRANKRPACAHRAGCLEGHASRVRQSTPAHARHGHWWIIRWVFLTLR